MAERLLEVKGLKVRFTTEDGVVRAVDDVSFELDRGKVLGVVGESGSGKSVTAMTILGLTRDKNTAFEGEVLYQGTDLLKVSDRELQDYFDQYSALADVTKDTVRQYIVDHVGTGQFIQVAVLPR